MFERNDGNIGEIIKTVAIIFCCLGIAVSVIAAIVMFSLGAEEYGSEQTSLITLGFVFLFVGPIGSIVSFIFTWGFGELVDKTCAIERNTRNGLPTYTHNTDNMDNTSNSRLNLRAVSDKLKLKFSKDEEESASVREKEYSQNEEKQEMIKILGITLGVTAIICFILWATIL